jgi:dTDP-4-dehydrorhamnose reductase
MKICITGSGGRLGAALFREYKSQFDVVGFNHAQLDLGKPDKIRETLGDTDFDLLINAAAFTNVDLAEKEKDQAYAVNAEAPRILAEICRDRGAKLVHFSTDYVFDGKKTEPYTEDDPAKPISAYGESKRAGEEAILSVGGNHLVARVSWVFGPDRPSFVDQMIERGREHETIAAVADKVSTPTYTRDITSMLMAVYETCRGVLHLANSGQCTWQEYAQHALDCCHENGVPLKAKQVGAVNMGDMKSWVARRPVHTVLATTKYEKLTGVTPRPWRDAVAEYVREFVAG